MARIQVLYPARPPIWSPLPTSQSPLQDASSTTLNAAPQGNHSSTTTSKQGRKRKAANAPDGRASKRTKGPTAQASSPSTSAFAPPDPPLAASHCGVGPLASPGPCDATSILDSSASVPPLHSTLANPSHSGRRDESKTAATDVWYFLRALDTPDEPAIRPENDQY